MGGHKHYWSKWMKRKICTKWKRNEQLKMARKGTKIAKMDTERR